MQYHRIRRVRERFLFVVVQTAAMSSPVQIAYNASLVLLVAASVAVAVRPNPLLTYVAGAMAAATFVLTYLLPERRPMPLILTSAAAVVFVAYGQFPIQKVLERQVSINGLIALVVLVPFLGVLFEARRYVEAIGMLAARASGGLAYAVLTISAHLVGAIANVATVSLMFAALGRTRRFSQPLGQRMFSQGVAHGYITSAFWSPNFATLTLSLKLTGLRFTEALPVVAAMGALALGINVARGWWAYRGGDGSEPENAAAVQPPTHVEGEPNAGGLPSLSDTRAARLRWEFLALTAAFLSSVVVVEAWTHINILVLVPMLAVACAVVAFPAAGLGSRLWPETRRFLSRLDQRRQEVGLFLAAGLLSGAVAETPAGTQFVEGFVAITNQLHLGPGASIPIAIVLLAFAGLPPLVSVLFLASVLSQSLSAYPPALIILSLSTGITVGHVSAPFSTTTMLLSAFLRKTPVQIVRWNAGYGVMLFAAMQVVAYLIS